MEIKICIGSSCHLKGSEKIVELLQKKIAENNLDAEISLAGSFCTGQCNRIGVTVIVDNESHTGITPENFETFFSEQVMSKLKGAN